MTARIVVAAVLVAVAVLVAWWLDRRPRRAVTPGPSTPVPAQLHRQDFPRPDAPWLVVCFTSSTCESCGPMSIKVAALASPEVAVFEAEYGAHPDLHRRYGIDAVPITVVVDQEGVARASVVGPASAGELFAAVARAREPAA